jgi:hypothetical protein
MTQPLRIAVRDRSYTHCRSGRISRPLWERSPTAMSAQVPERLPQPQTPIAVRDRSYSTQKELT